MFAQEMHAEFVESNLLNQVRVVWEGQVFPIWIQSNLCIFVKTGTSSVDMKAWLLSALFEVPTLYRIDRAGGQVCRSGGAH